YLEGKNTNLQLFHLKADQVDQVPAEQPFDTVIVNSVSQYFPGIAYFEDMLLKAFDKLSKNGVIFLGDIRNYDLQKQLITEKLQYAGKTYQQQDIDRIALRDNEFLLSPTYFTRLPERYADMEVSLLLRNGSYDNELSRYRYDVLITRRTTDKTTINKSQAPPQGTYNLPFLNQLTNEDILSAVRKVLPDYMVPTALVQMDSFPLTTNSKLDRRALPDPETGDGDKYVAPQNETQTGICNIWQEVLGISNVGIDDDFFQVGGNSILAIQASHRMTAALAYEVKVADLFRYKTPAKLSENLDKKALLKIDRIAGTSAPLSFAQERLWFIEQYEQGTNAYHMPMVLELTADCDIEGLRYALGKIVDRHEVLRSIIKQDDRQQGIQVVQQDQLQIEQLQLSTLEDLEAMISKDINHPFNLTAEYPIRVRFYDVKDEERTVILINTHHIASDGWSMEIFLKELLAYYEAFARGDLALALPPLDIQYKDFAVWQRNYLSSELLDKQLHYWKDKLSGFQTLLLPTDFTRPASISYAGSGHKFNFNADTSNKLRMLAREQGTTLHSVLLSAFYILLGKYSGQDDITVGSPIANRHHSQIQELIGFFVNTQANRTILSRTGNFMELVRQVHEEQISAQSNQDLPFEKLVEELEVQRDTSRHPVFQTMFVVQSFTNDQYAKKERERYFQPFRGSVSSEVEKFDLSVFIDDSDREISGLINYAASLFKAETIVQIARHFIQLVDQLSKTPYQPYSKISLLGQEEFELSVNNWSGTLQTPSATETLQSLFTRQATENPEATAIISEGSRLSYQQLDLQSNQFAHQLRKEYLRLTGTPILPDTLIPVCMDRSKDMIVAILGILKAGAAYVPVDPAYPQHRIDYILSDTDAKLIVSQQHIPAAYHITLPEHRISPDKNFSNEPLEALPVYSAPENLAYVIYTSGTTGNPKGVMVEHRNILSLVNSDYISVDEKDTFAFLSSPVFDAATLEIWTPLLKGAVLAIHPDVRALTSNPQNFAEFLSQNQVSVLWLTKTLFDGLFLLNQALFSRLKYLIIGGEALDKTIVNKLISSSHKPANFLNGYGPTESTTFSCTYTLAHQITGNVVPIGKPIPNRKVYILDSDRQPVPIGIVGELYISGAGLARGYLNNIPLTEARFIENPFASALERQMGYTRMYKSGDLVKWLPDGNIAFLGRNDDQVKIRGYRIELAEIEHAITAAGGIAQACVVLRERPASAGPSSYLTGYYVPQQGSSPDKTRLTEHLKKTLPDYMVPAVLVQMDSFPLSSSGKLDKRLLPDPDIAANNEGYLAPQSETETEICAIWQDVLGIERIGIADDFFQIGGNSILAMQVSHRMSAALGAEIKVADLFRHATIEAILEYSILPVIDPDAAEWEF
ncbi:hypothetical protein DBR43_33020, partial [Pedobacter sp. KBW06]|uniref:non-ribosomal peptide synthetase n=1 Tax=Pedobacter sp. KBW06 TaxID=2153359 RepID=UPI000F5972ED